MRRSENQFVTAKAREAARRLGAAIRAARLARNLTQADLAQRASISALTLLKIERGEPSVAMASWLLVLERVGLLSLLDAPSDVTQDPVGEAARQQQQRKRARATKKDADAFDY